MEFAVNGLIIGVDEFESMRAVSVHVPVSVRDASVREEEHHLVRRFGTETQKVPKHVFVLKTYENTDNLNKLDRYYRLNNV